jgi:hypothetical protein
MSRSPIALLALLAVVVTGACGNKIGDSCATSRECSENGDRICDVSTQDGYCTIEGCDFGTCPDEATCIRFFPGLGESVACEAQTDCDADEICTIGGLCAPRSIERRYCMLSCESASDCRDGYECRTIERMEVHGGEPVPDPDSLDTTPPNSPFCAPARPCLNDSQCDLGDTCDFANRTCTGG